MSTLRDMKAQDTYTSISARIAAFTRLLRRTTRARPCGPGWATPTSSRPSRSAGDLVLLVQRRVWNIGGSSELIVIGTPALTSSGKRVLGEGRHRAGADVGGRAHLEHDAGGRARYSMKFGGPGRPRCRGRCARRRDAAARPRSSPGRWTPPRAGTLCSPAAWAWGEVRRELRTRHAGFRHEQNRAGHGRARQGHPRRR